jgi:hypothetical protein
MQIWDEMKKDRLMTGVALAMALLLVLVAGCSSTTTDGGTSDPKASGHITIREDQVLRMGDDGGVGEGTLIFQGWQHKFEVKNMILGSIGRGTVELDGEVWNLERVEDFAGTYRPVAADVKADKGLSGLWAGNEKGVRIHIRTKGQDIEIRLHTEGSVVTLK